MVTASSEGGETVLELESDDYILKNIELYILMYNFMVCGKKGSIPAPTPCHKHCYGGQGGPHCFP